VLFSHISYKEDFARESGAVTRTSNPDTMLSIFIVVLLAAVQPISCWGSLGHRTVAYLAEKYFTNEASQFVQELLKNDRGFDISDAALFADKIKFRRPATKVWHYIGESEPLGPKRE
jgi:hypothetical protein